MISKAPATSDMTASRPTATTKTMLTMLSAVPRIVKSPARVPPARELAITTETDGPGMTAKSRQASI
ncbi:hypothetical protein D3C86_2150570 [compost metagenome]